MTIANLRYNHLAPPWDAPLSFGVQAFIEYNGLVINDRHQEDRIRVTGITGLDDADVRDAREPRPGTHGEIPYDAYYGGRTITLTGAIEAGSLHVLKSMERDLKAAFAPLVESALKFRWFDISDNFDDPQSILPYEPIPTYYGAGNYEALIGSNYDFNIENGFLSWNKAGKYYLLRVAEKRVFGDVQSTIRILPGSLETNSSFGFIYGVINSENYVRCLYEQNNGEPSISIQVIDNGNTVTLERATIPANLYPSLGIPFYFRGKKEGNTLTAEFWASTPNQYNLPTVSVGSSMEGTDAYNYGGEVLAPTGLGGYQADTLWKFDSYKIESLYPGDVVFNVRKLSSLSIKDEQTSLTKYKRSFQIVLRSSDFRALNSNQLRKSFAPTSSNETSVLGRVYRRSYPLRYRKYITSTVTQENNILSINNKGTVFIDPVIVVYGPFSNISIKNLTNNQEIYWAGSVSANDYLIFDCGRAKTVTNSIEQNKLEQFYSNSSAWIVLEPGQNDFYVTGTGFTESSFFVVYWQHSFM